MLDTHRGRQDRRFRRLRRSRTRSSSATSAGYEDGTARILRNVSFSVRAGQMIAIVGRSGAGKTTQISLLPRFFDVIPG
jgi:ABC-type multidrug transport system fused ATPase/permease subunit